MISSQLDNLFIVLSVDITVSDINPDMLEVGKKRATERGIFNGNHILNAN